MPVARFQMPDGRVGRFEVAEGTTPEQAQILISQSMDKSSESGESPYSFKNLAGAAIEPTLAVVSGAMAAPIAGLAGIAGTLLPGTPEQGERWTKGVQKALTLQPTTSGGALATDVLTKPFQLFGEAAKHLGRRFSEMTGSPAIGAGVNAAIQAIPLTTLRAKGRAPEVAASEMRNEVRDATYNAARAEGYKFPASATSESFLNRRLEGVAGKQPLNQEMILHNQQITNKIAAREVGLPENTALTPGRLEMRRNELAAPYREASSIDAQVAADVKGMREARTEANRWFKFAETHPSPRVIDRANNLLAKAEQFEGYIEEAAIQAGKTDLISRLRKARVDIAKTYDVERALFKGSGNVSAPYIGALLDKGKPLSGGLETIGKAQQSPLGPYMREADRISNPGVEPGGLGNLILAASASGPHIGWFTHGIPMLGGPARSLALSDFYQNQVGKPSYPTPTLKPSLASLLSTISQREQQKE